MNELMVVNCYENHVVAAWLKRPATTRLGRTDLYLYKDDVVIVLQRDTFPEVMCQVLSHRGVVWVFYELLKPLKSS